MRWFAAQEGLADARGLDVELIDMGRTVPDLDGVRVVASSRGHGVTANPMQKMVDPLNAHSGGTACPPPEVAPCFS